MKLSVQMTVHPDGDTDDAATAREVFSLRPRRPVC